MDTGPTPAFLQAFKTITGKEWTPANEVEIARDQRWFRKADGGY